MIDMEPIRQPVQMQVLIENAARPGLQAEHGWAVLVETGGFRLLFDTGASPQLLDNAHRMGVDLTGLDGLALSHGHYDHTGGLAAVLERNPGVPIYAHPDVFLERFSIRPPSPARAIGIPPGARAAFESNRARWVAVTDLQHVGHGLHLTGPVQRRTSYEDVGGPFFLDPNAQHPDPLNDDQALFFLTSGGPVVLLGCAHAGVVNTLYQVAEACQCDHIHGLLGGMHLVSADRRRMDATLEAFEQWRVARLGPAHCTGQAALAQIHERFGDRCFDCSAGARFEFQP